MLKIYYFKIIKQYIYFEFIFEILKFKFFFILFLLKMENDEHLLGLENNQVPQLKFKKDHPFQIINYKSFDDIKYDDYYFFEEKTCLFFCKLCTNFNGTKKKGNVIRHLDEQHFFGKNYCKYCNKPILRIGEHFNRCKAYNSKEGKNNISFIISHENKNEIENNSLKNNKIEIFNDSIINKRLLNNKDKILIENIFFYKNKEIGSGAFCNVFLGGYINFDQILAIKIIEANNKNDFDKYIEEKGHIVSLQNKGNFPLLIDWEYNGKYIFFAESLMGPSIKEIRRICSKQLDILSVINIAIDLISQIEIIHNANILHGDIKPSNICYGNFRKGGEKFFRTVGYLDFGNSLMFKNKNKIIEMNSNKKATCTREYCSFNTLNNITGSRRDDLESIIYTIIKIYTGKLPWQNFHKLINDTNIFKTKKRCKSKTFII